MYSDNQTVRVIRINLDSLGDCIIQTVGDQFITH